MDVVTDRLFNLHDELMGLLDADLAAQFEPQTPIYASAYRPNRLGRSSRSRVEVWMDPLAVGGRLPTLPLALRDGPTLPIDLDASYAEARRRSRLA